MYGFFFKIICEFLYILGYIDNLMIYVLICMFFLVRKFGSMVIKNLNLIIKGKIRCIIDENMIKIDVCYNICFYKFYVRL